jgi:hypothetical protein
VPSQALTADKGRRAGATAAEEKQSSHIAPLVLRVANKGPLDLSVGGRECLALTVDRRQPARTLAQRIRFGAPYRHSQALEFEKRQFVTLITDAPGPNRYVDQTLDVHPTLGGKNDIPDHRPNGSCLAHGLDCTVRPGGG